MDRNAILADATEEEEYVITLDAGARGDGYYRNPSITFTVASATRTFTETKEFDMVAEALVFYKNLCDSLRAGGAYFARERQYNKNPHNQ